MAKVGILTFSDGRDFVHEGVGVGAFARDLEDDIAGALENVDHEVVRAREVIRTNRLATSEARCVADERPDLIIFNIDEESNENLTGQSTYAWSHTFAKVEADACEIPSRYGSNHIRAIPGDHVEELKVVCRLLGVDYDGFGSTGGAA